MSALIATPTQATTSEHLPGITPLGESTRVFASRVHTAVSEAYLEFRRVYYHEANPDLATVPPAHAEIHQAEIATLAENTLRWMPSAVKSMPIIGGFLIHLQQAANIHSLSERERTALHNMAMLFLHGVKDGVQSWYVEWLLATAKNLSQVTQPDYYMTFPWEGLLYKQPHELAAFEVAVASGDIPAIEREIAQLAHRLEEILRNPIGSQAKLAFTGPESERREHAFNLKTDAALAIAAYFLIEEVRTQLHPRVPTQPSQSVAAPLPAEVEPLMIPHERRTHA